MWDAFLELCGMTEKITPQDVHTWMQVNGVDDPDYLFLVMGLERERQRGGV